MIGKMKPVIVGYRLYSSKVIEIEANVAFCVYYKDTQHVRRTFNNDLSYIDRYTYHQVWKYHAPRANSGRAGAYF